MCVDWQSKHSWCKIYILVPQEHVRSRDSYAWPDVHVVDQAADASAVLIADAKRGSCGYSGYRQCSKCWSAGTADSGLLRLSTTTKDVAISGQAHVIDKATLQMLLWSL